MFARSTLRRPFSGKVSETTLLILGAGAGGVTIGGKLLHSKAIKPQQVTLVDGESRFYYKPGWTLLSNELIEKKSIEDSIEKHIPRGMNFVNQYVERVEPKLNQVVLRNGDTIKYQHLIVASGIQFNWDKIKGFKEALEDPDRPVASVYHYETLDKIKNIRHQKPAKVVYTVAPDPITCGGAPIKQVYLNYCAWKKMGYQPTMDYYTAMPELFAVPFYSQKLERLFKDRNVGLHVKHELIEITKDNKAIFQESNHLYKHKVEKPFDYMHAVPPMSGRDFLKDSGLVNSHNFVLVDKHTLQHQSFKNVWSLGDTAELPTSKTMTAAIEQATVLEKNLTNVLQNKKMEEKYDGYTGCPIPVSESKAIFAEFKYDHIIQPTFWKDQRPENSLFMFFKRYIFPFAAMRLTPLGLWKGRRMLGPPSKKDYKSYQKRQESKNKYMS